MVGIRGYLVAVSAGPCVSLTLELADCILACELWSRADCILACEQWSKLTAGVRADPGLAAHTSTTSAPGAPGSPP